MKIAIFAREVREIWAERFISILNELKARGADIVYHKPFHLRFCRQNKTTLPEGSFFSNHIDLPDETDIFLCFGGDGTFLESLTLVREKKIPVGGINFGRLGFLTSAGTPGGDEWIARIFEGNFNIEKRSVLAVNSDIFPKGFCRYALNEVSFQRQDPFMLSVHVKINGMSLPPYWSDGLVLSSPTGSTAYSLSVGGPIAIPGVKALILAPIAPHNLNVRPLVVPDDAVIEIYVESRIKEAIISLDNRSISIPEKELFTITKAGFELHYLSFSMDGFIGALKEKLLWGEDKRNY
jgi:NAD+ kinase